MYRVVGKGILTWIEGIAGIGLLKSQVLEGLKGQAMKLAEFGLTDV